MQLIRKDGTERDWYLVKEWITKVGFKARIHKCVWNETVKKIAPSLHDFYTGYVQVPDGITPDEDNIDIHGGITFNLGKLMEEDGQWMGFDLLHLGDEDNQNIDYVEDECEKLATQIRVVLI